MSLDIEMASDEEEFDCLLSDDDRAGTYEDTTKFGYTAQELTSANVLTFDLKGWMKRTKQEASNIKFFKYAKTLQSKGRGVFAKMAKWYVDHCIKKMYNSEQGKKLHLKKLLMTDPVGTMVPGKDDEFCWTKSIRKSLCRMPQGETQ